MTLMTRNSRMLPVDPFEVFGREFSNVHGVDVRENADTIMVDADLPGFKKDEIEIVLDKTLLTISAKHAEASPAEASEATSDTADTAPASQWLLRERSVREYKRAFRLPATADGAAVSATLEDGVLHLTLTKREETKPRRITVN